MYAVIAYQIPSACIAHGDTLLQMRFSAMRMVAHLQQQTIADLMCVRGGACALRLVNLTILGLRTCYNVRPAAHLIVHMNKLVHTAISLANMATATLYDNVHSPSHTLKQVAECARWNTVPNV